MGRALLVLLLLAPAALRADDWPHTRDATGDWGGARSWLAAHGVTLDLDYTAEGFVEDGGAADYRGNVDLIVTLEWWKGGTLFIYGQHAHGGGVSDEVDAVLLVSNLEAPAFTQLSELWVAQVLGPLTLRLGKQDANRDFAGPRYAGNFVNSSYGAIPTVPMPTFPAPALGVAALVDVAPWLELRAGGYEGAPEIEAIGAGLDDGVFLTAAAVLRHSLRERPSGLHTLGVWHHTGQDRSGVYGVADVRLFPSRDPEDPRSVQLFVRGGWSPAAPGAVHAYVGGGATAHGFLGRDDTLGLGAAHARGDGVVETFIELFYKLRPLEWLTFAPDVQLFFVDGDAQLVAGLRVKLKL